MMETIAVEKKELERSTHRNDVLKLLACVTMLVDHVGYMYFPNEILFRIIGRLAFPIFAYQIALGYSKTSNLKRYVTRLSLFALIAQIPYSFFNPNLTFNPIHSNILFTFITGIGLLYVYDMGVFKIKNFFKDKNFTDLLGGLSLLILAMIILIAPEVVSFIVKGFYLEYGLLALALVLLFYIFQEKKWAAAVSIIVLYLLHGYYRVALFNSAYSSSLFWSNLFHFRFVWDQLNFQSGLSQLQRYYFNAWGIFSLIPILSLEKLNLSWLRFNKYVGYIFYPAHMAILIVIALLLRTY